MNMDTPKCNTPVGTPCIHCTEAIVEGDQGIIDTTGYAYHYPCFMRSIIGSAAHQLQKCSCYGGAWEDPPELTKRQAAQLALDLWEEQQSTL
jgi:hypothetical protein